jgi:GWxTD domain-containing protein
MARARVLFYIVCLFANQASGQFESTRPRLALQFEERRPYFSGDYACFSLDDTLTYTELYFQVPLQNLHFARTQQGYAAEYELELSITDASGAVVFSRSASDKAEVATYAETQASANARALLLAADLRPGAYRLSATAIDRESGKRAEAHSVLRVKDFGSTRLSISDLQFSSTIELNSSVPGFVKNNRRVVPNVPHVYGDIHPNLFVYYEIYNFAYAAADDSFRTVITIEREGGQVIARMLRRLRKPGTTCVQSLCLPIADFPTPGNVANHSGAAYRLRIEVTDPATGHTAESIGAFMVWHQDFSFSDYSLDELADQLKCIANDEEMKAIKESEASQRQAMINAFWKSKDPSPASPENELMDEYYRRVKFAEESFSREDMRGWQSPRGQIYVRFGPPDSIRRIANTYPTPNYQVWEYAALKRKVVFAEMGQDSYELLDPVSFSGVLTNR